MKKMLFIFTLLFSLQSWGCILIQGEIRINDDSLTIHQKFKLDESFPYRTQNFLIHIKLLSANKKNDTQSAQIIVRHPKTFKILLDKRFDLTKDKEIISKLSNNEIKLTSKLKLKHI